MVRVIRGLVFALAVLGAAGLAAAPAGGPIGGLFTGKAHAQQLVADLSRHLVAITTGFVGTDVLFFGAVDGVGDVIVVVRGPSRTEVVRRKSNTGGIWLNTAEANFVQVPSYYALAASSPPDSLLDDAALSRFGIGLDNLTLPVAGNLSDEEKAAFREGFIRAKVRNGLYVPDVTPVTFLGNRLFRTTIAFPDNVPVGSYTVQALLVRDGVVVSAQTTPLLIAKAGAEAEIYQFAHRSPVLYGIMAILLALFAGWAAGAIFRKT